jgi:arylsulfatase A-like enzyme
VEARARPSSRRLPAARRLLLAWLLPFVTPWLAGCGEPHEGPNLLLVVVDTLRKDALGLHGHPEPVSPHLDALAARGWAFENHLAHASQTVPSMLSLLLSQLPAEHGFRFVHAEDFVLERPVYPEELVFLAEAVQEAGFETAGYTANPYLTAENQFDQGFDHFTSFDFPGERGEVLTEHARTWLAEWEAGGRRRPFFLYVHYMDVHQPYDPPEPWRSRFVRVPEARAFAGNKRPPKPREADRLYSLALYAAATAYVDDQIGSLLAALEELGVGDDTVVAVTSDHGEEFLEHRGIGHGLTIYGEVVRVPLILVAPGRLAPGRRIAHLSQHLDLAPTLLALLDVPAPPAFRGRSVLVPAERVLLDTRSWTGVYHDGWNLLARALPERSHLFAQDDELDLEPIEDDEVAERLRAHLEDYDAMLEEQDAPPDAAAPEGRAWSEDELQRLRALGYLE